MMASTDVSVATSYQPRPVRFQGLWEVDGWVIKQYGIARDPAGPRAALLEAAKQAARGRLPHPPKADGRFGVGFLIVHDGALGGWALIDWWAHDVLLHHHVFKAPSERPSEFTPVDSGLAACCWELAVIAFERDAWVETMLQSSPPSVEEYLSRGMSRDV